MCVRIQTLFIIIGLAYERAINDRYLPIKHLLSNAMQHISITNMNVNKYINKFLINDNNCLI